MWKVEIAAAFFGVTILLLAWGLLVAVHILRIRDVAGIIGMTAILGPAVFMILANALGYLLPIRSAFRVTVVLLLLTMVGILSSVLTRQHRSIPEIRYPPRGLMWLFVALALIAGITFMRILPSDALSWTQFPLASTIAEGNFPVMQPTNPWHRAHYHYGPELLVAAFHSLTSAPLEAGYALQPFLGIVGLLAFTAALAYGISSSWRVAAWAAVLAVAGTGFAWLNVTDLFRDLTNHFLFSQEVHGPFRAIWSMYKSPVTNALLVIFMHRSSAMGFPLLYGLLYGLDQSFRTKDALLRAWWILVNIVLSLALALTMETGVVVAAIALPAYLALLYRLKQISRITPYSWRQAALMGAAVILPSLAGASVQGGMLTRLGSGTPLGSFSLNSTGSIYPMSGGPIALWSWEFLGYFGLPLLLLPLALWYLWRGRAPPLFALLAIVGFLYFTIPLVVQIHPFPWNMTRLFWGATSFFSLLVGIYLSANLLESQRQLLRLAGLLSIASMLASSVVFLGMSLFFPTHHFETAPLFARLPVMSNADQQMVAWVRTHTSLHDDLFFTTATGNGDDRFEQGLFMARTGRFSVGHMIGDTLPPDHPAAMAVEHRCDPEGFHTLQIRYLAVTNAVRAQWFREQCRTEEWELQYDGASPAAPDYPRIYELREAT